MEPRKTRSAGGIVLGDSGTIAMVRHQGATAWLFPKGTVEDGESDEQAARREIAEETGLVSLELIDDLGTYTRHAMDADGKDDASRTKEIHMFLFAAEPHAALAPTLEIEEARWVSLSRLVNEIGNAKDKAWFTTVFERVRHAVQRD
ncbi:MAG: NUDIX domain-containing protein [Patescibacteria group bacterium]